MYIWLAYVCFLMCFLCAKVGKSTELGTAAAHDLVLADQFGAEFTAVQREVNIEVDTVEDALGCVHALEVGLEVLA